MKKILLSWLLLGVLATALAQRGNYAKMSSLVRRLALTEHRAELQRAAAKKPISPNTPPINPDSTPIRPDSAPTSPDLDPAATAAAPSVCAFVRIAGQADSVLQANGCRLLASVGDIAIADIPLSRLNALSLCRQVSRIEAGRGMQPTLDTMATVLHATDVYAGQGLPQAYTGRGVVVGLMDVGFDTTHPNFYDDGIAASRIQRFWDQLSTDTVGSSLYVGADYTSPQAVVAYGGSRDKTLIWHGTHTLGIAAGCGYDTKFRGMAPGSDICLVSNAVTNDTALIADEDLYKYTYATDALGFKYIFDYAESVGRPCVVSFSEGSSQDLRGDDILYYEMLDRLSGPGRIIVSSAGNNGHQKRYMRKPQGTPVAGTAIYQSGDALGLELSSADAFDVRLVAYGSENDTLTLRTRDAVEAADSLLTDTVELCGSRYVVDLQAFPHCYDATKTAYDLYIQGSGRVGLDCRLTLEVIGREAEVEAFATQCYFSSPSSLGESMAWADGTHNINSPSSAPCVISVGATTYRSKFTNMDGGEGGMESETDNRRSRYSSVGPTFDARTKPDVMAPGLNIFSSMGSQYLEANPEERTELVGLSTFEGRQYPWCGTSGTSMSSPAVAGIIALWLEANPELTKDDIIGVFERTCRRCDEESVWPNNRYGWGLIDAYAGLLDILGLSSIDGLAAHQPSAVSFRVVDGGFEVVAAEPLKRPARIRVYSTSGALLHQQTLQPGQSRYAIRLDDAKKGVVAVQIDGPTPSLCGSSLLRI